MMADQSATAVRPGASQGVNHELSMFADVIPGQEDVLRETIAKLQNDPGHIESIRRIGTLHESRWVLFDDGKRLLFATTFDGDWDKYIDDFATANAAFFDDILQHVQDYPGITSPKVKDYIAGHQITATQFTRAYDAPVTAIRKALEVNAAFQKALDDPAAAEAFAHPALKPLLDLAAD